MRAALSLSDDILKVDGREYDLSQFDRILVIGAGKASAAMAEALEEILDDRLHGGIIATKYDHGLQLTKTKVMESGHPVPDHAGELASKELLAIAGDTTVKDLVFCLLSGGASAIVPAPRQPVTLPIKQAVTRKLLECGATINEINAIRKHLSNFKGGHLAKSLEPSTVITLIISDVVGDYLDVIGSGPTAPDESTFLDCQAILDKYALCADIPDEVNTLISDGCAGNAPETCKQGDSCFNRVQNVIIAGNSMAVNGAAETAQKLGYTPVVVDYAMEGEAREVAASLIHKAGEYCDGAMDLKPPVCLLAGGETTVTIKGKGKGAAIRNSLWPLPWSSRLYRSVKTGSVWPVWELTALTALPTQQEPLSSRTRYQPPKSRLSSRDNIWTTTTPMPISLKPGLSSKPARPAPMSWTWRLYWWTRNRNNSA